ncbi:MAG: hypothetical protein SNJ55_09520 [Chloroherpetonaceae bacterium]
MKKTLLFIAVALIAITSVDAQPSGNWIYVAESSNAKYAVLKSKESITLNTSEQIMEMWVKVEFNRIQPNGTAYQLGLQRFDLKHDEFAFREVIGYNADGKVLYHHRYEDSDLNWQTAPLRSVGKELLQMAQGTFTLLTGEAVARAR